MEMHQLRYFVATAETGSASRAAARCGVAQPSLSQQVKKLEASLGVRLFDRLGSGMVITDAGRALLPRARAILAEVREAHENLQRDAERDGSLTVGAIPTIAPYVLPSALAKLRKAVPGGEVSVREDLTEHLVAALVAHEIDCALLGGPAGNDLIECETLFQDEFVLIMPPADAHSAQRGVCPADLLDRDRISLHEEHCLGRQIEGFCAGSGVGPRIVCRTTQLQTVFELVALGLGISIVPGMAAAQTRARVAVARFTKGRPTRQIVLAWRKHRSRSAAATRFAGFVRAQFERAG